MFNRKTFRIAAGAAFVCTIPYSHAQVSVQPSAPRFQEAVHVVASPAAIGAVYIPNQTLVSMSGNMITVSVQLQDATMGEVIPPLDVVLGELPAGSYDVSVVKRSESGAPAGIVGTAHFDVAARDLQTKTPMYDYSDLWWKSDESGWGLSLTQHPSTNLFAAWFVYGVDSRPIWYIVPAGSWATPTQFSGAIYKTVGPYFEGAFDPSQVVVTPVGSATLSFSDYSHGFFSYTIDGVAGSKAIERQPF